MDSSAIIPGPHSFITSHHHITSSLRAVLILKIINHSDSQTNASSQLHKPIVASQVPDVCIHLPVLLPTHRLRHPTSYLVPRPHGPAPRGVPTKRKKKMLNFFFSFRIPKRQRRLYCVCAHPCWGYLMQMSLLKDQQSHHQRHTFIVKREQEGNTGQVSFSRKAGKEKEPHASPHLTITLDINQEKNHRRAAPWPGISLKFNGTFSFPLARPRFPISQLIVSIHTSTTGASSLILLFLPSKSYNISLPPSSLLASLPKTQDMKNKKHKDI